MPRTIRTFIAVNLKAPRSLQRVIDQLGEMGRAVRPVSPDGLHVTLKFLGDVSFDSIKPIAAAVDESVQGIEPFSVALCGTGAFPRPERPSVVWAGIKDAKTIVEIAERLEERLALLGFPQENRPFHPHATLAYVKAKPPPELSALMEAYAETQFGTQEVTTIDLMQSELTQEGPRYAVMHAVRL